VPGGVFSFLHEAGVGREVLLLCLFSSALKPQRSFHRAAVSPARCEGHTGGTGRLKSALVTASVQPNFAHEGCLGGMCRRPCPVPRRVPGEVSACVLGCARVSLHGHVRASPWLCSGACSLAGGATPTLALPPMRLRPGRFGLLTSVGRREEGWRLG